MRSVFETEELVICQLITNLRQMAAFGYVFSFTCISCVSNFLNSHVSFFIFVLVIAIFHSAD